MKKEIWAVVKRAGRNGVSMVELERKVPGFTGEGSMVLDGGHVMIWNKMSPEAVAAISSLQESGRIVLKPAGTLIYELQGRCLSLPITTRTQGNLNLHWFPVLVSLNK